MVTTQSAAEVYAVLKKLEHFTKPDRDDVSQVRAGDISQAYAQSVSDAIVRVRPYKTRYQDGAFVHEILDLVHAQIELVNLGVLIRAGLTVGDVYLPDGDGPVFGPALVRAYELESKEAIYPRIVIDDHALDQHKRDSSLRSDNNSLADERKSLCDLLAVGDDGIRYIDYLGAPGEVDDYGLYLQFLQTHAQLIRKGKTDSKGSRITRKYEWLAVYHNKRVEFMRNVLRLHPEQKAMFYNEYEMDACEYLDGITVK